MQKPWLNSYSPGVPADIEVNANDSLVSVFAEHAVRFADFPAFTNLGESLSYRELEQLSAQFASYLQQLGLQKGDRVALMLPNILQYPIALLGVLRAGLVVVNINPLYTAREMQEKLADAQVSVVVALENFAHVLQRALQTVAVKHVLITELGDMLGGIKGWVVNAVVKYVKRLVPAWDIDATLDFKAALKQGARKPLLPVAIAAEDLAFLQYTGGTTGVSKGAMLSHGNVMANVNQCFVWLGNKSVPGEEVMLVALPLYHIFSLTICFFVSMAMGANGLLITNPRDMKGFIKTLSRVPVGFFVGINTLFNALVHHKDFSHIDFSKLKFTLSGGMSTQQAVADQWFELTKNSILEGYGLTEASPVVAVNPADQEKFIHSIGLPMPSTDVQIRNDQGAILGIGEEGELWVKGPQVMVGYWNNQTETDIVLDAEGWLATGDVVLMDERGFLYLVDRKKDMILVSGFNVYPNEIEEVVALHPGVKEVAAIGVPDEYSGEVVKIFVVKGDPELTEAELKQHCRSQLTGYKRPQHIEFRTELPKSTVGKVLRRELR